MVIQNSLLMYHFLTDRLVMELKGYVKELRGIHPYPYNEWSTKLVNKYIEDIMYIEDALEFMRWAEANQIVALESRIRSLKSYIVVNYPGV